MVSIPYLRVTHDPPYDLDISYAAFQSPIYGSRTFLQKQKLPFQVVFQSPIYGSRTEEAKNQPEPEEGFNPLSTGHALIGLGK